MPPASSTVTWKSTCSSPVTCTSSMMSVPQVRVRTSSTGTSTFVTKVMARASAMAGITARAVVAASVMRPGRVTDMVRRPLYGSVQLSPPHPRSAHMAIDVPDGWGLEGKVAIVSGGGAAGDGIGNGRAAAILLARAGARVVVVDRDKALAQRTVEMIKEAQGAEAIALDADVTQARE